MKYLLFFILVFLLFRFLSYMLSKGAQVRTPGRPGSKPNSADSNRFRKAEDAEYEIIEDEDKNETKV